MKRIRCDYCHREVDYFSYADHCERHRRLRPDGQQTDYVTLPVDERERGSLDGVPRVYVHRRCDEWTEMPEDIVRSYLKNPYLYLGDKTYCAGCEKHVPFRECNWTETGEDLQTYMDRLRAEKPERRPGILIRVLARLVKLFG